MDFAAINAKDILVASPYKATGAEPSQSNSPAYLSFITINPSVRLFLLPLADIPQANIQRCSGV